MELTERLQFWFILGPHLLLGNQTFAKNQDFCKTYIRRNIKQRKSEVPEKSRNSCKIK